MTDTSVREDDRKYELMVIINPDIGMDAISKRLDEVRSLISSKKGEQSGEIFYEDIWGMRDFAYRIKKHERGFYGVFDFIIDPSMIREIDSTLRLEPEVLRHLIVTLPFSYEPRTFIPTAEEEAAEEEAKKKKPYLRKGVVKKEAVVATAIKETPAVKAKKETAAEEAPAKEELRMEETVVKEEKEAPAKVEKKKEPTLEEVDAKLKSIIENPDINF